MPDNDAAARTDFLAQWDRDHFFHPSTHLADHARGKLPQRILIHGDGVFITDRDGNRFLDGFAGLYCVNAGYGRSEIAEAIARQAKDLPYYHAYVGHGTEASITLARMVIERAPVGMSRVFFGLGGSDANETLIKIIWYYNNVLGRPDKKKLIGRKRGFHGSGLMTGSLTGLEFFHKAFDLPLSRVLHTEAPYYFHRPDRDMSESDFSAWCAERLEALILDEGPDTIAAFFGEPMLGTGGLVPPPEGYWPRIQAVLKKYDILFVADEVITGFGRLGTPFGSHFYGLQPDLITIAKGLTSAYAPLSGAVISKKVFSVLAEGTDSMGPFGHGLTYSAHPIGAAAGVANLSLIDDLGLMDNARKVGTYLRNQVREALEDHPHVGEIRGEGLTCAIELVENRDGPVFYAPVGSVAPKIAAAALRRGVIVRAMPHGDIIGIAPPFSLTRDEADSIVTAVVGAIHEILG